MQDASDITKGSRLDRVDKRAHARSAGCCKVDFLGRTVAALRDMGRRTTLAQVDDLAGDQCISLCLEAALLRARPICADQLLVEMGLGPVKIDPGRFKAETSEPIRLD